MNQLITITPEGDMHGLQTRKPGDGVDLRKFGQASIKRVSDVKWDTDLQKYYVVFLKATLNVSGRRLTDYIMQIARGNTIFDCGWVDTTDTLYFNEHSEAVKAEHEAIQGLRLRCGIDVI